MGWEAQGGGDTVSKQFGPGQYLGSNGEEESGKAKTV